MIIETTSLSKTYSMAGWRMGFAVGNKCLIAALARVKSYLDYGAFTPIQVAACAALDGPQDTVEHARAIYRARRLSPGVGFGENGEGYVRIALVENEQRIRQAARNIRSFLASERA